MMSCDVVCSGWVMVMVMVTVDGDGDEKYNVLDLNL